MNQSALETSGNGREEQLIKFSLKRLLTRARDAVLGPVQEETKQKVAAEKLVEQILIRLSKEEDLTVQQLNLMIQRFKEESFPEGLDGDKLRVLISFRLMELRETSLAPTKSSRARWDSIPTALKLMEELEEMSHNSDTV